MTIQRHAFLTCIANLFGIKRTGDLRTLVENRRKPLLLPVRGPVQRIHVYEVE